MSVNSHNWRQRSAWHVVFVPLLFVSPIGHSQAPDGRKLAVALANPDARTRTVEDIVSSGRTDVPLLLELARRPPRGVDRSELYIGLAEVFGRLRVREALPFLIANISLGIERAPNIWLKTDRAIAERMPAVAALIRIGPAASLAVMNAWAGPMTDADRLAAIFVVGQIQGVPDARAFLQSVVGGATLERNLALDGIKALSRSR